MNGAPSNRKAALWLMVAIVSASCMGFYVVEIWGAGQPQHFSDLYAPWWGAHEFLLHGRNPYSAAVAHEIQSEIYGTQAVPAYRDDPSEFAGGFAYPLYTSFFLWPTVYLSFPAAKTVFLCGSILAVAGSALLWMRAFRFRPPPVQVLAILVFTLGSFPALQGIRLLNLSLLAAALLAVTLALLASGRLILAGIFLAASTLKPQFTIILVPGLALWSISDWKRRQALAWSFAASMALLIGAAEWLQPGWIGNFVQIVGAYRHYTFGRSLLDVWFTPRGGPYAAAVVLVVLLWLCWPFRRYPANAPAFSLAISLLLAGTLLVVPTLAPHTQILLLPGVLCLLQWGTLRAKSANRFVQLAALSVWLLLAWPWLAAATLTAAASVVSRGVLQRWWELPLYTSPILPLAVCVALVS